MHHHTPHPNLLPLWEKGQSSGNYRNTNPYLPAPVLSVLEVRFELGEQSFFRLQSYCPLNGLSAFEKDQCRDA